MTCNFLLWFMEIRRKIEGITPEVNIVVTREREIMNSYCTTKVKESSEKENKCLDVLSLRLISWTEVLKEWIRHRQNDIQREGGDFRNIRLWSGVSIVFYKMENMNIK